MLLRYFNTSKTQCFEIYFTSSITPVRSVKIYYVDEDLLPSYGQGFQIAGDLHWFWTLTASDRTPEIHTSTDPSDVEHVLLPKYTLGQFLILEKTDGILAFSEISMEFSESREKKTIL